ncbi:MAG: hydantoinase/oxoprolinase family protein [Chloroflexota bacterium]|nr:hydantoinase/oxoprolinase family protein [Chloroflexota bacterium]
MVVHNVTANVWRTAKVLVERDVETSVLRAMDVALELGSMRPEHITFLAHGTTVATNIVIERKGARVGLITTRGFRDVLEIGRQNRPSIFDSRIPRPEPLVPRNLRQEVDERVGPTGEIVRPINRDDVCEAAKIFRRSEIEAVAISLLHAWVNPTHEQEVADQLARLLPSTHIVLGTAVVPEFGEYERTSTTVVSAYVGPRLARYLRRVSAALRERGITVPLLVMQSNGGLGTTDEVMRRPTVAQFSGPAAGVIGTAAVALSVNERNVVALDVGGTSTDVALITDGQWRVRHERAVAGQPVLGASIAVESIGAGGGSIAWIDGGGLLKVGPESAGALPGPACYGRGGTGPTVTDAHLLLGYISAERPLAQSLALRRDLADAAIAELASRLATSPESTAAGIIDVTVANIVRAVRRVTVEAGHDPREFALVAYGGGGPLYANQLIAELGMRRAIIPARAGVECAIGLLSAGLRLDLARTHVAAMTPSNYGGLSELLESLWEEARERVIAQARVGSDVTAALELDLRYRGQNHQLTVPLCESRRPSEADFDAAIERFHAMHKRLYGVEARGEPMQSVTARAVARVLKEHHAFDSSAGGSRDHGSRRWRIGSGWVIAKVAERDSLTTGEVLIGPALIDSDDCTIAILPGYEGMMLEGGVMVIAAR